MHHCTLNAPSCTAEPSVCTHMNLWDFIVLSGPRMELDLKHVQTPVGDLPGRNSPQQTGP